MKTDNNLDRITLGQFESILTQHMTMYGYEPIALPVIEPADIFLTRAGDNIIDHLFTFQRKGQTFALRPEFTAAVAHRYVERELNHAVRWQVSGSIFEDQPDQSTHNYQRPSVGAEFLGQSGISSEAEIIAMAYLGLQKLQIPDLEIVIGHVGLQNHSLNQYGLDRRTVRFLLDHKETLKQPDGKQTLLAELHEMLGVNQNTSSELQPAANVNELLSNLIAANETNHTMGGRSAKDIADRLANKQLRAAQTTRIEDAIDFLEKWIAISTSSDNAFAQIAEITQDDESSQTYLRDWMGLIDMLAAYDIPSDAIIVQPDLTRNWQYYTGIVFGVRHKGTFLAGGGRYDDLTTLLGHNRNVPAVGFAYYLANFSQVENLEAPSSPVSIVINHEEQFSHVAAQLAQALRQTGLSAVLQQNLAGQEHLAHIIVIDAETLAFGGDIYPMQRTDQLITDVKSKLL